MTRSAYCVTHSSYTDSCTYIRCDSGLSGRRKPRCHQPTSTAQQLWPELNMAPLREKSSQSRNAAERVETSYHPRVLRRCTLGLHPDEHTQGLSLRAACKSAIARDVESLEDRYLERNALEPGCFYGCAFHGPTTDDAPSERDKVHQLVLDHVRGERGR